MARVNNYQTMMQELQALLADMQAADLDVDEAMAKYERGQKLIAQLEKYLSAAENKILESKVGKDEKAS